MSYSKVELQAMFDDTTMLVAEIIPSFKADALRYLNGAINFAEFELNYGGKASKFLLKIEQKFNAASDDIKNEGIEAFAAQELNGFSADDIAPIVEHWIKSFPQIFRSLLHKYPGAFSFLHGMSHFERNELGRLSQNALEKLNHLIDAVNAYEPSCALSAEYLGTKEADATKHGDFRQAANWSLTTVLSVAELLCKDGSLEAYKSTFSLNSDLVKKEQEKRQQRKKQGAEKALEFLAEIKQTELNEKIVNSSSTPKKIAEHNKTALELAILKGKNTFGNKKLKVSVVLDVNPKEQSALEKLELVDNIESVKVKQANRLLHEASTWIQDRMAERRKDIQRKPKKAHIEEFQALSEADAIARGEATYSLSPEADSKGEMHFGETPTKEGKNGINERLKLLGDHLERNKITGKAISALMDFIDTLRHLPDLIETSRLRRAQSAPNMHNKPETPSLKKRSLSDANVVSKRAEDNQLVTAAINSHAGWFAPVKPKPTNADMRTINKIVSMVPRLLRMPGTRST